MAFVFTFDFYENLHFQQVQVFYYQVKNTETKFLIIPVATSTRKRTFCCM